jgi:hypothetical protein
MMITLIVGASVLGMALLATVAFSGNWLATGIRGTVRTGFLGVLYATPFALILVAFGVFIYAIIASILYLLDMVE